MIDHTPAPFSETLSQPESSLVLAAKNSREANPEADAVPMDSAGTPELSETVEHTEASAEHAAPSLLHNDYTWIGLSFVICLALIARYLMPVINKSLDGRAEKIRDQLEQASRLRKEAEELLASYQAKQKELLAEAESLVENAKRDAVLIRERAATDLKQALERRSQQAQEKIARAEAEAVAHIRARIVDAATESARAIIASRAAGTPDDEAIARAISTIEKQIH
jgi:F-type H+-transporting ATPase subunit b